MKTVFVLFDSLNRHLISPYGGDKVPTPNFDRLAARSRRHDGHYVGSMPCMPARRDLLTGRMSFLHRSWGPLEPFDNAFTHVLQDKKVYSHLITDHYHYWEDGGSTYHNRYDSYEFVRGQEGDSWKGIVAPDWEKLRPKYNPKQFGTELRRGRASRTWGQDIVNREYIKEEADFPAVKCFEHGLEFLKQNRDADDWLLQIETFDPHEPFMAPEQFKKMFDTGSDGPIFDWPVYGRVDDLPEECDQLRANYYATVAMCDHLLGKILDDFDEHNMWEDTALVVTTDHGFLLGEHDFWAKNKMNIYQELANIPLFIHDPRRPERDGTVYTELTQNIDLAPTFLDLFDAPVPAEVMGHSLVSADPPPARDGVMFGFFGGAVHLATHNHTYHRYPVNIDNQEVYQYTLMPSNLGRMFPPEELTDFEICEPFGFTKGARLMKIPMTSSSKFFNTQGPGALIERDTRLYDIQADPRQEAPLQDPSLEDECIKLMTSLMASVEAPPEAYTRLGLPVK